MALRTNRAIPSGLLGSWLSLQDPSILQRLASVGTWVHSQPGEHSRLRNLGLQVKGALWFGLGSFPTGNSFGKPYMSSLGTGDQSQLD